MRGALRQPTMLVTFQNFRFERGLKEARHSAMLTPHHILRLESKQIAGVAPPI